MKKNFKKIVNSNIFHKLVISLILLIIFIIAGLVVLKYAVEGESAMPYEIEKISIISSSEGVSIEESEYKWAYNVAQVNDVYIYIKENENINNKLQVIEEVEITNVEIKPLVENGQEIKIYKPDEENAIKKFETSSENQVETLIFEGDYQTNMQEMKIGYQGGMIGFRCSNNNIGVVESDEEEIDHLEFLKNIELDEEELNIQVAFTLKIKLKEGTTYAGDITIDLPVGDVIQEGITSVERTDIDSAIFKRIN